MKRLRSVAAVLSAAILALCLAEARSVLVRAEPGGLTSIQAADLREWLTYVASDTLEGRALYSAGLGLAAGYIQDHLRAWNVRPAGEAGTYLQTARVLSIQATSRTTVAVQVGDETRIFHDGDGITLPRNQGGKRTVVADRVEFVGYGLDVPAAKHEEYKGKDVRGAAVVWLGTEGPRTVDAQRYHLILSGRHRYAADQLGAIASIGPGASDTDEGNTTIVQGRAAAEVRGQAQPATSGPTAPRPDFTTARRLDAPVAPAVSGSDDFLRFVFSRAPTQYDELKRRAAARDSLPSFPLAGVKITFNVDVDYEIVRTQLTHNIVGIVEGSDPALKNTYVALGAHYDHVGYAESEPAADGDRRPGAPGKTTPGAVADRIWNGADDDGSGTVALMALARAFAEGLRPKRSILFVWHTGEERGLYGSRYFADYPAVPIDSIVAQLNIDMIGRNRDDKPSERNTVYLVGSDRISTELDDISSAANRALPQPLRLDYEMNDPSDPEQIYFRSDHYSYALKGIPVIFFTTGLHADYHSNTDEVSKIEFDKLARVAGLVYETAVQLGNLDHPPVRDNKGPRAGRASR
jgi:peptidase M28-like protein